MYKVIKNKGKMVEAYKLGEKNPVVEKLIDENKIVDLKNGKYEIFSQEVLKAESKHGELANAGDYIKIDSSGAPYPNTEKFFNENHKYIEGDTYEQIPKELIAWDACEPVCDEIKFLTDNMGLVIDENNPEKYYTAPLWGTIEVADKKAVIIFYDILYNEDGSVKSAEYNLVERNEFEKTYMRH
ncbi:MAG: hypothetical protein K6G26_07380 [Lachnospiraceae bacterium]|nr:hypothetical protein [Lachnospiraceae bacterium]